MVLVLGIVILQEIRDIPIVRTENASGDLIPTEVFNAANDTLVGIATFSDFWVIIVLGIVAVVVIGLLLRSFGGIQR